MSARAARGVDAQTAAAGGQMQEPARAGMPDDDDELPVRHRANGFVWILRSVLRIGGRGDDVGAGGIKQEEIVIVGGSAERVRPKKVEMKRAAQTRGDGIIILGAKAVHTAGGAQTQRLSTVNEIAFPLTRPVNLIFGQTVVLVGRVACCGKIKGSAGGQGIDCLRQQGVLKWRLIVIIGIVHQNPAAGGAEQLHVGSVVRLAAARSRKKQLGSRRQIVDNLKQRRAFATIGRTALSGNHGHESCDL